ncbi:uncharacterized protein [Coffea arabica]|uniref:Uncharacterized protein n=1 Tax=Coffea arabica TaxID=13443 RepID=A0ABM4UEF8_COFAR
MRLNPKKCTFGVRSEKFLGFLVSREGIRANPDKLQAIMDMAPPRNVKEVQRLMGRMAALNRFLSCSAVRGLPFFRILKVPKDFQWTEECQKAFTDLKAYLAELPALAAPEQGETLFLYLSACNEAVSEVLVREDRGVQRPIYYVSRALQGPETRYTPAEKLVLALVHAARKLRPYFQAHSIVVMTDQPLRQMLFLILRKLEVSDRMTKWAVELAEHDISYQPRTTIKAQALADFLVEGANLSVTEPSTLSKEARPEERWVLFVDGASSKEGSGAGLLLISPTGEELTYALRFDFSASNNEAEYEALLTGLRIAHQMGVTAIRARSDSQLVVHQVRGEYEAKEDIMKKYLAKVREAISLFDTFEIEREPRSQNKRADALSKLASSSFAHLNKEVLIRAAKYAYAEGTLYRRSYLSPWLKCVTPEEGDYVLREVHEGLCVAHVGSRVLAKKCLFLGYYWPSVFRDAAALVQKCRACQFAENPFWSWCAELGISQHIISVGHPQANGQVENANRTILQGLKTRLELAQSNWLDELSSVLWAYRTTPRIATNETPFSLTYGAEAVVPTEVGLPSSRTQNFVASANEEELRCNLDMLEAKREEAAIRMAKYKSQLARYHNAKGANAEAPSWACARGSPARPELGSDFRPMRTILGHVAARAPKGSKEQSRRGRGGSPSARDWGLFWAGFETYGGRTPKQGWNTIFPSARRAHQVSSVRGSSALLQESCLSNFGRACELGSFNNDEFADDEDGSNSDLESRSTRVTVASVEIAFSELEVTCNPCVETGIVGEEGVTDNSFTLEQDRIKSSSSSPDDSTIGA